MPHHLQPYQDFSPLPTFPLFSPVPFASTYHRKTPSFPFEIVNRDLDVPEIQGTTQEVALAKCRAAAKIVSVCARADQRIRVPCHGVLTTDLPRLVPTPARRALPNGGYRPLLLRPVRSSRSLHQALPLLPGAQRSQHPPRRIRGPQRNGHLHICVLL